MEPYVYYIIAWCIVVIVSIVVEVSTVSLTSIWFAMAGIASLVLAAFNVDVVIQIVVFVVLSIVLLFLTRPFVRKYANKSIIHTNADKVISMIGIVTKTIPVGDIGEVKVNSEFWRAVSLDSKDINIGEKIVVNSLNGNKLLVSRAQYKEDMEII